MAATTSRSTCRRRPQSPPLRSRGPSLACRRQPNCHLLRPLRAEVARIVQQMGSPTNLPTLRHPSLLAITLRRLRCRPPSRRTPWSSSTTTTRWRGHTVSSTMPHSRSERSQRSRAPHVESSGVLLDPPRALSHRPQIATAATATRTTTTIHTTTRATRRSSTRRCS